MYPQGNNHISHLGKRKSAGWKRGYVSSQEGIHLTLPQTNVAPENKVSEKESIYFPNHYFSIGYVSFRELFTMCLPICVLSQPLVTSTRLAGCLKAPLSTTLVAQPMRWAVYRKRKHDGDWWIRGVWDHKNIGKIWWTYWNVFMKMEWDHGISRCEPIWIHLARIKTHESCNLFQSAQQPSTSKWPIILQVPEAVS